MKLSNLAAVLSKCCVVCIVASGCGGEQEADRIGVASPCEKDSDCPESDIDGELVQLSCLSQFDAGYCAIEDCDQEADCPSGATCVAHDDGTNYCFRECRDKSECNANRPADSEANCSANFDYADPDDDRGGQKACIPPSSG
jgi:hypothetical protein